MIGCLTNCIRAVIAQAIPSLLVANLTNFNISFFFLVNAFCALTRGLFQWVLGLWLLAPDKEGDSGFENIDALLGCDFLALEREDHDVEDIDVFLDCDFLVPEKEENNDFEDMTTPACHDF